MRIIILLNLFLMSQAHSKVAYLPLIAPDVFYPEETDLGVLNLENGNWLAQIPIGNGVGAVFLNDSEDMVYASAQYDNKIVAIDASTLTIAKEWNNLPSQPQKIFLSQDQSKLFFIKLNVGTGNNSLYQINLITDEITEVLNYENQTIRGITYSENLNYLTATVFSHDDNLFTLFTYDSNNLALIHQTQIPYEITTHTPLPQLIDNAGENYFYFNSSNDKYFSRKLSDGSENWRFSYPDEEQYYPAIFKDSNNLYVFGHNNNYLIDVASGVGTTIVGTSNGSQVNVWGSQEFVDLNSLIVVKYPTIACITGFCFLGTNLEINQVDVENNTSELLFESSDLLGSAPESRFIGENLFGSGVNPAVSVPILNSFWIIFLVLAIFIALSAKQLNSQRKIDN
ncbi:MAG: hypothetical protein KDI92_13155 [Xanthomonadales bacterium]|nr:hypothetical protein [Xanthomonadales bacterium]